MIQPINHGQASDLSLPSVQLFLHRKAHWSTTSNLCHIHSGGSIWWHPLLGRTCIHLMHLPSHPKFNNDFHQDRCNRSWDLGAQLHVGFFVPLAKYVANVNRTDACHDLSYEALLQTSGCTENPVVKHPGHPSIAVLQQHPTSHLSLWLWRSVAW